MSVHRVAYRRATQGALGDLLWTGYARLPATALPPGFAKSLHEVERLVLRKLEAMAS